MQRRGVWRRRIGRGVATVAVGGLLGFLVPKVMADFAPTPAAQTGMATESPLARKLIDAYAGDDQETLKAMGAPAAMQAKASRFKAEYQKVDRPVYLGSWVVAGGQTVHAYSAHVLDNMGREDQLAWRVVTLAGSVGLLDPPPSVTTP